MGFADGLLKKIHMVSDDDEFEDDYDEFDDLDEDEEEEKPVKTKAKNGVYEQAEKTPEGAYSAAAKTKSSAYSAPSAQQKAAQPAQNPNVVGMSGAPVKGNGAAEVCMIMPKSFADANAIADMLLSHRAVVLNLEGIDITAAQRIIDFASGACYTVGGSLQKISKKVFIVVPQNMNLSGDFGEIIGDMVDLNTVNM